MTASPRGRRLAREFARDLGVAGAPPPSIERVAEAIDAVDRTAQALVELDVRDLVARQLRMHAAGIVHGMTVDEVRRDLLDRAERFAAGEAPLIGDGS